VLTFGVGGDTSLDVRAYSVQEMPDGSRQAHVVVGGEATILSLQAIGYHHLKNAVAALAAGYALGVPLAQAIGALESWKGAEGRMAIIRTPDGLTLLDDCYNAGPESMEVALITLFEMTGGGGVAVLGDMRELGDFAPKAHRFVGRKVLETDVRLLVTVGELAEEIGREVTRQAARPGIKCPDVRRFASAEEAAAAIGTLVAPGDTVLVKGSRAMQMEKIVAALTLEQGAYCHA
jgi:UDP-N-acetylmuramyl pentapeptide synthase